MPPLRRPSGSRGVAHRVGFDPAAREELRELYAHIASRSGSPDIAERYIRRIVDWCLRLADAPERGSRHDEVRPGLRSMGFENRVTIAFVVEAETVTILRVLYGGRDTRSILGS